MSGIDADIDIEALLEAPYKEPRTEERSLSRSTSHKENKDHDKDRDRERHRRNSEKSSRHSERPEEREDGRSERRQSNRDDSRTSRDRDRERSSRHSNHGRDRDRDRTSDRHGDRDRTRDRDRERERDRHSGKDRDRERDRDRDRHRDRDRRPSSRDRDRDRSSRPITPREEPPKRERSPELTQSERDRRTVFVMQIAATVRERDLIKFFEPSGRIRDVRIVSDRGSRRSKGVGYVEFYEVESIPKAISQTNQRLMGVPVIVEQTEAEKNRLAEAQAKEQQKNESISHKLYVGSLHFNLSEDDIKQVFEPFGIVDSVQLHLDDQGRSKGFAFVQYRRPQDARRAMDKMNGLELSGRSIRVGLVNDKPGGLSGGLLDDESAGFAISSTTRAELMQKLARDTEYVPPTPAMATFTGSSSANCLLTNMFDPDEETEPDWDKEIKSDVEAECEKYGQIEHLHVDQDSQGHVYIKFRQESSCQKAVGVMNGRWFAGKQIRATYLNDLEYRNKFGI